MKVKKKVLVLTISLSFVASIAIYTSPETFGNNNGAPASRTGSPGDGANCTACHTGTPSTVAGLITSNIPASGYIPGTVYTITATVSSSTVSEFGFEISPQNTVGTKMGTITITDATNTRFTGTGSKYVTHKAAGTVGTGGTRTWSFSWTAPVAGSGNVTFYGAFVFSNNNNSDTGDQVKLSSLAVTENLSAGVDDRLNASDITVYPNPVADQLTLAMSGNELKADVSIFDISGKLVKTVKEYTLSGDQKIEVAELPHGVYILNIKTEKGLVLKKIVKQ